jgi:CRP-like cAMP-binding protein
MLTANQAEAVADAVAKRRFKRGEVIVEQGEKSNTLFIILTGRARVVTSDKRGREVILATMNPGDYIGEMSLIDNEPHSATVRAEVQTDMLALGRTEFARCLPENSSMAYAIMKGLVQRLRQADRKIESLALMDVYGRVARACSSSASPIAQRQHHHPRAHLPPGHRQDGRRLARDGQPGDEGPGRPRLHRDPRGRLHADQGPPQHAVSADCGVVPIAARTRWRTAGLAPCWGILRRG